MRHSGHQGSLFSPTLNQPTPNSHVHKLAVSHSAIHCHLPPRRHTTLYPSSSVSSPKLCENFLNCQSGVTPSPLPSYCGHVPRGIATNRPATQHLAHCCSAQLRSVMFMQTVQHSPADGLSAVVVQWLINVIRTWDARRRLRRKKSLCVGVGNCNFVCCSREMERDRSFGTCLVLQLSCIAWLAELRRAEGKNRASDWFNLRAKVSGLPTTAASSLV
jgi:hypothetical protein